MSRHLFKSARLLLICNPKDNDDDNDDDGRGVGGGQFVTLTEIGMHIIECHPGHLQVKR